MAALLVAGAYAVVAGVALLALFLPGEPGWNADQVCEMCREHPDEWFRA
jgi:hypothetical protein